MKISYGAVLPLPPEEAFGFVADPVNWPLFFPGARSVDKDNDWGWIGGHARLTSVVLGRSLTMDLELTEWDPPRSFRYSVSLGGKPGNDDTRRTFDPVPGGTRLTGTTQMPARRGPVGLLDRLQMLLVRRVFTAAMGRLPTQPRNIDSREPTPHCWPRDPTRSSDGLPHVAPHHPCEALGS